MRVRFLVHKFGSSAPRELCDALRMDYPTTKRLKVSETTFVPNYNDVIVNWGCIKLPTLWGTGSNDFSMLNGIPNVNDSSHRIRSLTKMKEAGVNVPEFTIQSDVAQQWLDSGRIVIARESTRSFGGRGITVVENSSLPLGQALYTRYRPKRREYRVHVFRAVPGGELSIINVQQKRRRTGFREANPTVDSKIRSYANGWVFAREGVVAPESVVSQSILAVQALGLDFAAVDVGWTEQGDIATVYECNTAPGLKGTSIFLYANAIRSYITNSHV